jgi:hypothetical protein
MGRAKSVEQEAALDKEQVHFGDLIRLDDLKDGENSEFEHFLGREETREG